MLSSCDIGNPCYEPSEPEPSFEVKSVPCDVYCDDQIETITIYYLQYDDGDIIVSSIKHKFKCPPSNLRDDVIAAISGGKIIRGKILFCCV